MNRAFLLQRFQHIRHLHRVDVTELGQLGLRGGLARARAPRRKRQHHELQMGEIERAKGPVHLSLIAMDDSPHNEPHRALGRAQRNLLEHGGDRLRIGCHGKPLAC